MNVYLASECVDSQYKQHKEMANPLAPEVMVQEIFILESEQHAMLRLINDKMPKIVCLLTFMSKKNNILGLSEPKIS